MIAFKELAVPFLVQTEFFKINNVLFQDHQISGLLNKVIIFNAKNQTLAFQVKIWLDYSHHKIVQALINAQ
jgi:hypothetical protein